MRERAFLCLALAVFLGSAFTSPTMQQAPTGGRQGGAPGGRQGGPPPVQLPEGAGREQVQASCARCHGLNLIVNSWGYTKDGWQDRIEERRRAPLGTAGSPFHDREVPEVQAVGDGAEPNDPLEA